MIAQVFNSLKMVFELCIKVLLFSFSLFSFLVNFFSLCCPWVAIGLLLLLIATKFIKLKDPDKEIIDELLACTNNKEENNEVTGCLEFPIANKYEILY